MWECRWCKLKDVAKLIMYYLILKVRISIIDDPRIIIGTLNKFKTNEIIGTYRYHEFIGKIFYGKLTPSLKILEVIVHFTL